MKHAEDNVRTHQIGSPRAQRSRRASSHHPRFKATSPACPGGLALVRISRNKYIVFLGGRNSRLLHFRSKCCHQSQFACQCLLVALSWWGSEWSEMLFLSQRRLSSFLSSRWSAGTFPVVPPREDALAVLPHPQTARSTEGEIDAQRNTRARFWAEPSMPAFGPSCEAMTALESAAAIGDIQSLTSYSMLEQTRQLGSVNTPTSPFPPSLQFSISPY